MKPVLSKRRAALIAGNYLIGYLFLYPLLISLLHSLLIKHWGLDISTWLENGVYVWVMAVTLFLAWPLLTSAWKTFASRPKEILKNSFNSYLWMWISMIALNMAIILVTGMETSQNQQTVISELTQSPFQILLVTVVFAPIVEETVFRGAIFTQLRGHSGFVPSALISGFLFGLLHVFNSLLSGNSADLIFILVYGMMGYLLCKAEEQNQTLVSPILMHMLNNLISVIMILI